MHAENVTAPSHCMNPTYFWICFDRLTKSGHFLIHSAYLDVGSFAPQPGSDLLSCQRVASVFHKEREKPEAAHWEIENVVAAPCPRLFGIKPQPTISKHLAVHTSHERRM